MNYQFIELLKQNYIVTELDHAFRVNGVIDIFKIGNTVYEIPKNFYHKGLSNRQVEETANRLLLIHPERPDFKKMKNGISYQEFKNNLKRQKFDFDTVNAEDYHWENNFHEKSEDHLYFAVVDDKVKIGRSIDVKERLNSLKTGLYKDPQVYVFRNKGCLETKFHHIFADFRIKGEWFNYDVRIQRFIKKYLTKEVGYLHIPQKSKTYQKGRTLKNYH